MDVNEFTQKGYYFSYVSFEMDMMIQKLVKELEDALNCEGFTAHIDIVPMSVWKVLELKTELQISLITRRINVNLLPVELVMHNEKWRNLQILINRNCYLREQLISKAS